MKISLMVTSKCQLDCEHCSQFEFKRVGDNYQMSMATLQKFAKRVRELNIDLEKIHITGGEPLLWKNLYRGTMFLKKVCPNLTMVTNGVNLEKVSPNLMALYNEVRITDHKNKIHVPLPTKKMTDEIRCVCSNVTWMLGKVYRCANLLGVIKMTGCFWPEWIMDEDDDWRCLDGVYGKACGMCIGNRAARDEMEKTNGLD